MPPLDANPEVQTLLGQAGRIVEILESARRGPQPGRDERDAPAREHLRRLASAVPGIEAFPFRGTLLVDAEAADLARVGLRGDPDEEWGSEWSPYRRTIADLGASLHRSIREDERKRASIGPPLWPIPGQSAVVGDPMIATQRLRERFLGPRLAGPAETALWLALAELETALHLALLRSIDRPGDRENPFTPLLSLAEMGYLPAGLKGDQFVLIAPPAG